MAGRSVILVTLAVTFSWVAGALAADPPAQADKQQRICRGTATSLGSHIRAPRRCLTAEQWQQEDEARSRTPLSLQVTAGQNDGQHTTTPQ